MAEIKALLTIILILFLFHIPKSSSKPASFSLKLIPALSSLSYQNMTFLERYKSNVEASKARASYWALFNKSTANKTNENDLISPPLRKEGEYPVAVVNIGTPGQQAFLLFDTGAIASWVQCASCTTCFPHSTPKFDPERSTTYRVMSSNDPGCRPQNFYPMGGYCEYESRYASGSRTKGIGSYDSFRDNNPFRGVDNVRFGCSIEAHNFGVMFPPDTIISGFLAMSKSEHSFPAQLSPSGAKVRFSYCMVDSNTAPGLANLLTFGDDIPYISKRHLSRVPFMNHRFYHTWAINVYDISVGNERLYLPPGTFANGPLILDSGTKFSHITTTAYFGITSKIIAHLSKNKDFTRISSDLRFCYRYNGPSGQLPKDDLQTVTLHLDNGADLELPVTSVYYLSEEENTFCLAILQAVGSLPNVLGARQQLNTRFIYDLDEDSLFFTSEKCTH